ncbi:MAG: hypothetical protein K8R86_10340 [Bacteroidales bacterium]|nr:hypothetical protein [Bacteroidales bacterium]
MRLVLVVFSVLVFSVTSIGQREQATGKTVPVTSLYDLGRVGYDLANNQNTIYDTTYIPYWIEKYTDSIISTNKFATLYPESEIRVEEISIIPPDLDDAIDAIVIMWYLQNLSSSEGIVNLMILTFNTDSLIYYHTDINNNRNFNDDGPPFTFTDKQQDKLITIIDNNTVYEFQVNNISYKASGYYSLKPGEKDFIWKFDDKKPSLSFSFSLSTGKGDPEMRYSPKSPSDTIEVIYTSSVFSSFNFESLLGVSYYRFYLNLFVAYEKEESGSNFEYVYINKPESNDIEKRHRTNTGAWPEYKLFYGGTLAYDIPIFRPFRISPYVGIGSWIYLKDHPFLKRDDYEDRYIDEYFTNRMYYTFGLDLKYLLSKKSTLFVHSGYKMLKYDASEYFINADPQSFKLKYNLWYIGAGVSFRLN